jgi:anti-sigma B factor antagonist
MTRSGVGFRLDTDLRGAVTVVALHGNLDGDTAGLVENEVGGLVRDRQRVLLDLDGTSYLSSAGLRVLLLIYRQAQDDGGQIAITRISPDIRAVLTATGFVDFFTITDTVDAGLEALAE